MNRSCVLLLVLLAAACGSSPSAGVGDAGSSSTNSSSSSGGSASSSSGSAGGDAGTGGAGSGPLLQAISGGNVHTCALLASGGVKCWGHGQSGELGNGGTSSMATPPGDVTGLVSGVTALAVGASHNCALLSGGGLKC